MQVILLENVRNLGHIGDTVNVKPGYGRNYLVPLGKAAPATKENVELFQARRAEFEKKAKEAFVYYRDGMSAQGAGEYAEALDNFVIALRAINEINKSETDLSDPDSVKGLELLMKEADLIESIIPQLEAMEAEFNGIQDDAEFSNE